MEMIEGQSLYFLVPYISIVKLVCTSPLSEQGIQSVYLVSKAKANRKGPFLNPSFVLWAPVGTFKFHKLSRIGHILNVSYLFEKVNLNAY